MNAPAALTVPHPTSLLPGASVGFKEWALVCRSMLRGETSVLFRKGGIAEGRQGFRFKHAGFFLFPTFFHEQLEFLRLAEPAILQEQSAAVTIPAWAKVEFTVWVDDLARLERVRPLHILTDEVLRQRFEYSEPKGLHLAFVQAYRLAEPWTFPYQNKFGGCRSWVELPDRSAPTEIIPVLADEEQARRSASVRSALPSTTGAGA
ncbi:MAG: DUF1802 family protein [Verrucomicrobia bacterium]|nr:DUF1802 family protein [Verrucomicrobiota bacterium]